MTHWRPTFLRVYLVLCAVVLCSFGFLLLPSRNGKCVFHPSRFRHIYKTGFASQNWAAEHSGEVVFQEAPGSSEELFRSWSTELLPYLDESELYESIDRTRPWDAPENRESFQSKVDVFQNPAFCSSEDAASSDGYAVTHYAANVHVAKSKTMTTLDDIARADGLSNSLWIGEAAGHFKPWGQPGNWRDPTDGLNESQDGFGAPDEGVVFVFGDGHVEVLSADIDPSVLHALSTPDGGETLSRDDF